MSAKRLDNAIVQRGLIPSRAKAQAAVLAGDVRVDGSVVTRPSASVDPAARIEVVQPAYVSRGGHKLAGALDATGISVAGTRAIDLGASTGGFTDCLLQRGADHVIAVDVGYGQLAWSLRNDSRVTVMERTNARYLTSEGLPYRPDLVVCDVAFIGIGALWPAIAQYAAADFVAVLMVKPQFEVGRDHVGRGGVVRDSRLHADAIMRVAAAVEADRGALTAVAASPLTGPKGNREFFLVVRDSEAGHSGMDYEPAVWNAVKEAP